MTKTFTDILGLENNVYVANKVKANSIPKQSTNVFINVQNNKTYTENGALTNKSTLSGIVDWFFHGAALRHEQNEKRIIGLFLAAFNEDPTKALRTLFYIRDIRGGQGERRVFRTVMKYLADNQKDWVIRNLDLIAEYGRYDDYLVLLETNCKEETTEFLGKQLEKDLQHHFNNELTSISLLAKWMPSENASSQLTKKYAKILLSSGKFGAAKAYRKALSLLRKDLDIVETKLCNKEYDKIDYSKLPSYAALKYREAFRRNDENRYAQYLEDVKAGKKEIKASTLYPYDLIRKYSTQLSGWGDARVNVDPTVEAQWEALPDYVPEINGLVVNDTSGSMEGLPMAVSVSLAVYIAERNKSEVWKNYVIPFSSHAEWKEVKGNTLAEKIASVYTGDCTNTNLQSVFDLILERAKSASVPQDDMPKFLLIISDMEFDCCSSNYTTNLERIKQKYKDAGYDLPTLVFWNVDSRNNQTPATINDQGVILLSGASPAVMKIALEGGKNMVEVIYKIIDGERYARIQY